MESEPERFDDEPRAAVYDCGSPEGSPCGECIVCLAATLEDVERQRDAAEAKACAWDALMEIRGSLAWNADIRKWVASAPTGQRADGITTLCSDASSDPMTAVRLTLHDWRHMGSYQRPEVDDRLRALVEKTLEDRTLAAAEEIKARRASEVNRGE
jgi:hypothetical protein